MEEGSAGGKGSWDGGRWEREVHWRSDLQPGQGLNRNLRGEVRDKTNGKYRELKKVQEEKEVQVCETRHGQKRKTVKSGKITRGAKDHRGWEILGHNETVDGAQVQLCSPPSISHRGGFFNYFKKITDIIPKVTYFP